MLQKENEWISVRGVQRKGLSILKGKTAENIYEYLKLLQDRGMGEMVQGTSHSSALFLAKYQESST